MIKEENKTIREENLKISKCINNILKQLKSQKKSDN